MVQKFMRLTGLGFVSSDAGFPKFRFRQAHKLPRRINSPRIPRLLLKTT
jgi:hypothetical protein